MLAFYDLPSCRRRWVGGPCDIARWHHMSRTTRASYRVAKQAVHATQVGKGAHGESVCAAHASRRHCAGIDAHREELEG